MDKMVKYMLIAAIALTATVGIAYAGEILFMPGHYFVSATFDLRANIEDLDFGNIEPGAIREMSRTITNFGNVPVTLIFNCTDPLIRWDYGGQTIQPHASIGILFTLTAPNESGDYVFDGQITPVEVPS